MLGSGILAQYFKGILRPKSSRYEMPSRMAAILKVLSIFGF
jgi:hypothetical protein